MRLRENVWVALPLENTWAQLTDLRRTLSCLADAYVDEAIDGEYRGWLHALSGAGRARYAGGVCFVERDEVDHRAVVQVRGSEEGGSGTVSGTATVTLLAEGAGTRIDLSGELTLSGNVTGLEAARLPRGDTSLLDSIASGLESGARSVPATDESSPQTPTKAETDVFGVFGRVCRPSVVPAACTIASGTLGYLIGHRHR